MPLQKEIIALGDAEMGGGTLTDDFISDNALSELILELCKRPHPVDLIFNGDTFDFLKCPYPHDGKLTYVRHITKEVSLAKLDLINFAHRKVFESLKRFVHKKRNRLYFTFGNHDMDLVFPEVQKKIKSLLKSNNNIFFEIKYHSCGVYVEHGMQYDFINKIDLERIYLTHNGKRILNLPWVSYGLISKFMSMKEEHPFLERIMARPKLFTGHQVLRKKLLYEIIDYFAKSIFYYPWRYLSDPTYTFPRRLFGEFFRRLKKSNWDVDKIVSIFKRRKRRTLHQNKVYVLGHIHDKYFEDKKDHVIVHPGSWRDEYDLDDQNRLIPHTKRYVQVLVMDWGVEYQLIDLPLKRSILSFDKVILDEKKYLQLAASEEGYARFTTNLK